MKQMKIKNKTGFKENEAYHWVHFLSISIKLETLKSLNASPIILDLFDLFEGLIQ